LINRWSGRWGWVARAKEFDDEVHKKRRKVILELEAANGEKAAKRTAANKELVHQVIAENLKKSLEMAKIPLFDRVTSDGKIVLVSPRWTFKDGIKLGEIAAKMLYGLPKAEDGQGDLREEGFEHMDFPAQDEKEPEKGEEEKE
jgi:hypothetical protein